MLSLFSLVPIWKFAFSSTHSLCGLFIFEITGVLVLVLVLVLFFLFPMTSFGMIRYFVDSVFFGIYAISLQDFAMLISLLSKV